MHKKENGIEQTLNFFFYVFEDKKSLSDFESMRHSTDNTVRDGYTVFQHQAPENSLAARQLVLITPWPLHLILPYNNHWLK